MQTIIDLPDALMSEIRLRAKAQRQDLEEAVAQLLRQGLAASAKDAGVLAPPVVKTHPKTGLPYAECSRGAAFDEEMTPEPVADLLLEQEVAWHHEAR